MSRKRKKKQTARQAAHPARGQSAEARDKRVKTESKKRSAAPAGNVRRWAWPAAAVLLAVVSILVAQALLGGGGSRPAGAWTLTILHTTDVEGYLDPCG